MVTEVVLHDGTHAVIWPVLPIDRDGLAEGYRRLDEEARYHRFLSSMPHLSEAMLDHLIDGVDGVDTVALVMIAFDDEWHSSPAGVARMLERVGPVTLVPAGQGAFEVTVALPAQDQ